MLDRLKKLFADRDKEEKSSAESHFDELMKAVDNDQTDLSKLEGHMREKWEDVHREMDDVRKGVEDTLDKAA
jgi:hypothetical protein